MLFRSPPLLPPPPPPPLPPSPVFAQRTGRTTRRRPEGTGRHAGGPHQRRARGTDGRWRAAGARARTNTGRECARREWGAQRGGGDRGEGGVGSAGRAVEGEQLGTGRMQHGQRAAQPARGGGGGMRRERMEIPGGPRARGACTHLRITGPWGWEKRRGKRGQDITARGGCVDAMCQTPSSQPGDGAEGQRRSAAEAQPLGTPPPCPPPPAGRRAAGPCKAAGLPRGGGADGGGARDVQ